MRQPPDKAERRPGRRDGVPEMHIGGGIVTDSITALVPDQARRPDVCWRCGVPIGWTDLAVLSLCTELARMHARPLRFEDIPPEDW